MPAEYLQDPAFLEANNGPPIPMQYGYPTGALDPSESQIVARCRAIQETWDPKTEIIRRFPHLDDDAMIRRRRWTPPIVKAP